MIPSNPHALLCIFLPSFPSSHSSLEVDPSFFSTSSLDHFFSSFLNVYLFLLHIFWITRSPYNKASRLWSSKYSELAASSRLDLASCVSPTFLISLLVFDVRSYLSSSYRLWAGSVFLVLFCFVCFLALRCFSDEVGVLFHGTDCPHSRCWL